MDCKVVTSRLLDAGGALWSSVACDQNQERWIVYADLRPCADEAAYAALQESERIFKSVLPQCLGDTDWMATVLWSDRVSYTIARHKSSKVGRSNQPNSPAASSAPATSATRNPGMPAGPIPDNVSVKERARVTAGFANDVEAVNQ